MIRPQHVDKGEVEQVHIDKGEVELGEVEQVHIESKYGHCILLDRVNCRTQYCVGHMLC